MQQATEHLNRVRSHLSASPSSRCSSSCHLQLQRSRTSSRTDSCFSTEHAVRHSFISNESRLRRSTVIADSAGGAIGSAAGSAGSIAGSTGAPRSEQKPNTPLQQRILNGILGISNVPYSSYVPTPTTFLHTLDARVKQLWLVALYFLVARATPELRIAMAAGVAVISMIVLPTRLWTSQLSRLGALCAFIFVMVALAADGVPPLLQTRAPPPGLDGLPALAPTDYHYVILHAFFITITHRSVNLAITGACLTFISLQAASLCLVTTPGEEMALGVRWWLTPLRWLGAPIQDVALTLLLSLRFMSLVFEEIRNLALGLAARGVDWKAHGYSGSMSIAGRLSLRLFDNLFHRCSNIAQAMAARGFQGPEAQRLYMTQVSKLSIFTNTIALGLLAGLIVFVTKLKY